MKTINVEQIISEVEKMCIESNCNLGGDIYESLNLAMETERSETGKIILGQLIENADTARAKCMAVCQDTGMAIFFVDVGQDLHIEGGLLTDAINEGVRRGYQKGYLRKSVVADPLERINTGDNTPAIIHYDIVAGDNITITIAPKGFGSENMSSLTMLKPSDGIEGVKKAILDTVSKAGPNPCPPVVIGVGIGGSVEKAALLAKKALTRDIRIRNEKPHIKDLEIEMLGKINRLGIGPAGLGGSTTALGINIEVFPTHIAGLPVCVNISCHVTRHSKIIISA